MIELNICPDAYEHESKSRSEADAYIRDVQKSLRTQGFEVRVDWNRINASQVDGVDLDQYGDEVEALHPGILEAIETAHGYAAEQSEARWNAQQ